MADPLTIPVETRDPINAAILAISEDKVHGFQPDPIGTIAAGSGVDAPGKRGHYSAGKTGSLRSLLNYGRTPRKPAFRGFGV
jgi:hypothetical protein